MESASARKFYDIHCHAMTMAHPNLLAFLQRLDWRLLLLASPLAPLAAILGQEKLKNIQNLLSVMENDIGSLFLMVEHYLKETGTVRLEGGSISLCGRKFDSIVLTPLIMDFGFKNILADTFYKAPPQKPVVQQVEDIFNGIAKYLTSELMQGTDSQGNPVYWIAPRRTESPTIFEIYPFLGINTANYELPQVEALLDKYFRDYRGCYQDFRNKLGTFNGNIATMGSNYFAGIKLYPPIGFDPWPVRTEEKKKVEALYSFCIAHDIPVTVHCSDGGFILDKRNAEVFTSPWRWDMVLAQSRFSSLKLNFAHFGNQSKKKYLIMPRYDWRDKIVQLMKCYPNVHTDFSYIAQDDGYYQILMDICNIHPDISERIMFGSDFMINLLDLESYDQYLRAFWGNGNFCDEAKEQFCTVNPDRFLWRE